MRYVPAQVFHVKPAALESGLDQITRALSRAPVSHALKQWCEQLGEPRCHVRQAAGSLPAFLLHHLWQSMQRTLVCVCPEEDAALYFFSDLQQLFDTGGPVVHFPSSGRTPYDREQDTNTQRLVQRADVLQQLSEEFQGIIVTSVRALAERTPARQSVQQATRSVAVGSTLRPDEWVDSLLRQGFSRVRFVEQPGDIAWRGGIVDVYGFSAGYPVRLEFYGDEVASIRELEVHSQRSVSRLDRTRISPRLERASSKEAFFASFFDYVSPQAALALFDSRRFEPIVTEVYEQAAVRFEALASANDASPPQSRYLDCAALQRCLNAHAQVHFGTFADASPMRTLSAASRAQPAFNRDLKMLRQHLVESAAAGLDTYILCENRSQRQRLEELLDATRSKGRLHLLVGSLHRGFSLAAAGVAVFTDHEIFGRHHRPASRRRTRSGGIRLHELRSLKPGDFVVHSDFGVGTFAGFRKITVRDKEQEVVRLHYADGDVLYVNVNALHKLHKYAGKEGHQPRLNKLGSGQWERSKRRAKKRIKDIARDLIKLYARRTASRGYSYQPDSVWQREMEAAFPWEDTPDQVRATAAIKQDMEATHPMDRLVCGDVGFGKTEVAVRAAFKAAQESKQVAVLVPTTVLARQHLHTFVDRLAPFPIRVELLSRHRKGSEVRQILADLARGTVDILIGTHRLISQDVTFKDLGLLIVDEEQRFGVRVKERLRQMRVNVDTLTLTATPIPRTLQFSLMGARDLSLINTPPANRQQITTEIHSWDAKLVRDAILYEVSRGGQVFFLHNRVQSIDDTAAMLRDQVPGVRIQVAHGQMNAANMERVMAAFVEHSFDVLVATTIIENGLDIPNANTMIINHAQRFGLAELHQLRGRVGRSERKAYCYLLVPSIHGLTREARQRLRAVEQLSDLGGGFQLAMRDLDIRGAGNVLGGEQSGFMLELGLATYQQVLEEAVRELRTDEFPGLRPGALAAPASSAAVDIAEPALLPAIYVDGDLERFGLYRRLGEAASHAALEDLRAELKDRFGPLPREAENLFVAASMKLCAQALHLPRVVYRNQRLFIHLPLDDEAYREGLFPRLMTQLERTGHRFVLKDSKKGVPRAIIQNVPTVRRALELISELATPEEL